MRARWLPVVALAIVSFGVGGLATRYMTRPAGVDRARARDARVLGRAVETISRNYVDPVEPDSLYLRATSELVRSLHDPYAELLLADAFRRFNQQLSGTRIQLAAPTVAQEGGAVSGWSFGFTTPGRGINPGDDILAVDGRSTAGMTDAEAADLLARDTASVINLLIRPRGGTPVLRRVERTAVHVPAVSPGVMLGENIGYLALHAVTQASARELMDAVVTLRSQGMRSLVLDLRRNPGGLISQGVEIAELFLNPGDTIAVMRGRGSMPVKAHVARLAQPWPDLSLVVLVNRQTASSAEVIAAALQDHDRAVVIGTPTYGKGVIQTTFPLEGEVAVKFTTARWYAPSGRTIQREADSIRAAHDSVYRSAGGRPMDAGRAIQPDLLVRPRFSEPSDVAFVRQVRLAPNAYRAALAASAAAIIGEGAITSGGFTVSDHMRNQLWRALAERGVPVRWGVFDAASGLVSRELGYVIARQRWGEAGEVSRRAADDRLVRSAAVLLRRAPTQRSLIALTENPMAAR